MIQGLRIVVYRVADLAEARDWYATVLENRPYFDEPFYVGFDVNGFELGLQPEEPGTVRAPTGITTGTTYWGVEDADAAYRRLLALGATEHEGVRDVGGGIRVAEVLDPFGNVFGVIENPHFSPSGL